MATVKANVRRTMNTTVLGKGAAGVLTAIGARTIELTAPSASGTIVDFGLRIPSDARIDISSRLYFDDLATSGSPTFKVGFYGVDNNTATDMSTALVAAAAISAASAALGIIVPDDYANAGKRAWDLAGLATDPGGFFDVKGVVKAATTNGVTGTITLDLKTYTD